VEIEGRNIDMFKALFLDRLMVFTTRFELPVFGQGVEAVTLKIHSRLTIT
jgi:hypothetical protein